MKGRDFGKRLPAFMHTDLVLVTKEKPSAAITEGEYGRHDERLYNLEI